MYAFAVDIGKAAVKKRKKILAASHKGEVPSASIAQSIFQSAFLTSGLQHMGRSVCFSNRDPLLAHACLHEACREACREASGHGRNRLQLSNQDTQVHVARQLPAMNRSIKKLRGLYCPDTASDHKHRQCAQVPGLAAGT